MAKRKDPVQELLRRTRNGLFRNFDDTDSASQHSSSKRLSDQEIMGNEVEPLEEYAAPASAVLRAFDLAIEGRLPAVSDERQENEEDRVADTNPVPYSVDSERVLKAFLKAEAASKANLRRRLRL